MYQKDQSEKWNQKRTKTTVCLWLHSQILKPGHKAKTKERNTTTHNQILLPVARCRVGVEWSWFCGSLSRSVISISPINLWYNITIIVLLVWTLLWSCPDRPIVDCIVDAVHGSIFQKITVKLTMEAFLKNWFGVTTQKVVVLN